MRSISLSCPGCFATYEARFAGAEPPPFQCRFCGALLEEVAWEASAAGEEPDGEQGPELRLTQPPAREPRGRPGGEGS